ncbi:MAG: PcfJ domain-containing protein [Prevotella sp.]|nr:PcfJ domain-containing protein [Prevotella sp.]
MDCGHQWKDLQPPLLTSLDGCRCPNCGTELKVTQSRKKKDKQSCYYGIATTCGEFQVIRFFDIYGYYKAGEKAYFAMCEIVQRWLLPNGKHEIIAKLRAQNFSSHTDSWRWASNMEIRHKSNATCYSLIPVAVYPKMKCLPEIKRNGFRNKFHGLAPFRMFHLLLTSNKAETLLKSKQYSILKHCVDNPYRINDRWASIKIAIRNNYKIKDATMWFDYLNILEHFGKDLHNAKYVCPKNLKQEHDRLVSKRNRQEARERLETKKKKAFEDEIKFKKLKKRFFGIEFTDGFIHVHVLQSVEEYIKEGESLHHCVFAANYHLKPETLILSARINGKPVETIEISLKSMEVVQCRGAFNQNTEYHEQILDMVKKNIKLIRKKIAV